MPKPYRQALHTLEQQISAGNQFNGAVPTAGIDDAAELLKPGSRVWAADTVGGLFNWNLAAVNPGRGGGVNVNYVRVKQVALFSSANFNYVLSFTDGTLSTPWLSGSAVQKAFDVSELVIPPGWYLSLVTTGASAAVIAQITGVPEEIGR
jgi:hypothetical protein